MWLEFTGAVLRYLVKSRRFGFEALIQRFERIAQAPRLYPSVEYIQEGYRRSVCGVDSIYYRVNGSVVEIMRVLGRQDTDENL